MARIEIPVALLEFEEGGNTIWVHGADGATVLRVQAGRGSKIIVDRECSNICSHSDITVNGDINFCVKE